MRALVELKLFEPQMPWPRDRAARVRVVCNDGTAFTWECLSAEGGPDRPLSPETIIRKCDALAGASFPGFGRAMADLHRMEETTLAGRWRDFVARMIAAV